MLIRPAICLVILMKLFSPAKALAATCYDLDDNGTKWHKNLPNAKGVYPNSLYTVTASKPCKDGIYTNPVEAPTEDLTGQEKVFINPTYTEPNDCLYNKFKFVKQVDGGYLITNDRHDASQFVNGVRTCPYQ